MATQAIIGANPTHHDGGVIVLGGNIANSNRWEAQGASLLGASAGVRPTPKSGVVGVDPIYPANPTTFAQNGGVIAKVDTDLGGNTQTEMQRMDQGQLTIDKQITVRSNVQIATAIRNNQFNPVSGTFSPAVALATGTFAPGNAGDRASVFPSGGPGVSQGQIQFFTGRLNPTTTNLPAKSVW